MKIWKGIFVELVILCVDKFFIDRKMFNYVDFCDIIKSQFMSNGAKCFKLFKNQALKKNSNNGVKRVKNELYKAVISDFHFFIFKINKGD